MATGDQKADMPPDITERLRRHARSHLPGKEPAFRHGAWDMMFEAADVIDVLRRALLETCQRESAKNEQILQKGGVPTGWVTAQPEDTSSVQRDQSTYCNGP